MTLLYRTGKFNTNSSTGDQAVTGVGFQPKALIFMESNPGSTEDSAATSERTSFGVTDGTNMFAIGELIASGNSPGNQPRGMNTSYCVATPSLVTTWAMRGKLKTMDADGFTLTWDTASVVETFYYIAIEGTDVTNTKVGNFANPGATGNKAVTGVGFKPDFVLFLPAVDVSTNTAAVPMVGMGFTDGTNQGYSHVINNGAATTVTRRIQRTDKCLGLQTTPIATTAYEASIVSLDSDGFTVNFST